MSQGGRVGEGELSTPRTLDEALVQIAALVKHIAELRAKLEAAEARSRGSSKNSSRPPSSDPPELKLGPKRPPSGRKPGGQPGHRGHRRALLDPEKVTRFEDHWPEKCEQCKRSLRKGLVTEIGPERHQVVEVPPFVAEVIEHRLHTVVCPKCTHASTAALPPEVPQGAFGPRLVAMVGLMAGSYRLSKRTIVTALSDLFGVQMSLGSVSACERIQSAALVQPVKQAIEHVREQAVAHADETGWTQRRARAWLWVAATSLVTVFLVHRRRSGEAARALLGSFNGIVVSDRWSAYLQWPLHKRQLCWAHLKRDFQFIAERGPEVEWIGKELLEWTREVFVLWHQARDGTLSRAAFRRRVKPIREKIEILLDVGARSSHVKVAGMCRELLSMQEAMWTFVRVPGVDPTNNLAERSLRHAVLWRKASFGTHSAAGSRFVERMLTVVMSLRQQDRPVLEYLAAANQAKLEGTPPPSLIPNAA